MGVPTVPFRPGLSIWRQLPAKNQTSKVKKTNLKIVVRQRQKPHGVTHRSASESTKIRNFLLHRAFTTWER